MPTPAKTWALGLLFWLALSGFHHHHHHHGGGSSGSVGCGGTPSHTSSSTHRNTPSPELETRWQLGGQVVVSDPSGPAVATIQVKTLPGGAPVLGAHVTVAGVALTEAEPGTYVGQVARPAPGASLTILALGEHSAQVDGQMPAPATDLALQGDTLLLTEHGPAEALVLVERSSSGEQQSTRVEQFEEDARLSFDLPPQTDRAEVVVSVVLLAEGALDAGQVELLDSTAHLAPALR